MKPDQDIRKRFKEAELAIQADSDEQIFVGLSRVQSQQSLCLEAPFKQWRFKMVKPLVKLSMAALVAIAVLFMMHNGNSVAFAKVIDAIHEANWMYMTGSLERNGKRIPQELWMSTKRQVIASSNSDTSKVAWLDYRNQQSYEFNADINELTLWKLSPQQIPDDFLQACINIFFGDNASEVPVEEDTEVIDGVKVDVYGLHLSLEEEGQCHVTIVVDANDKRPMSVSFNAESPEGVLASAKYTCSYPGKGPKDIYALGVPVHVKLVDMLPSLGVEEIGEIHGKQRERFSPYVFVAVEPSQGIVYANRINGDHFRGSERLKYIHCIYEFIDNADLCTEIEEDVTGFVEGLPKRSDAQFVSAGIWDGKRCYKVNSETWAVKKSRDAGTIRSVGHFWPMSGRAGKIKGDDYSQANNLVAVKIGAITQYLDPHHDYACVRYQYAIRDKKRLVRDLGEFIQTEEGYWYPGYETGTVITYDDTDNELAREVTFTHRYFIASLNDLPKDYFNVDRNIAKFLEGRN